MGGKVWSTEEERVFWEVVVPVSPNAANPAKRLLSWQECVDLMKREIGVNARREYTHTMLYEHHYQNFKPGAKSPKANPFLEKHQRDIDWFKQNKTSPPPTPAQAPTSDDSLLLSLLNEKNKPKPKTKRGRKAADPDAEPTITASSSPEEVCKFLYGCGPDELAEARPKHPDGRHFTPRELYKSATGRDLVVAPSSFTPINQGGRNSLANPVANTATAPARNTVANSFANPAASTTVNSFAKPAVAPATNPFANSFTNSFASNSASALASSGQRKLPKTTRHQAQGATLTQTINRQLDGLQAPAIQASSGPNALLSRQPQSFESGIRGMATGARQDVRHTQGLNGAGTTSQAHGSSSYVPFYQGYTASPQQTPARAPYQASTQAPRQSPIQVTFQAPIQRKEEDGSIRLPSIREMFPFTFTGPEQEVFARREADAMLQNRKRSISVEDEQMPAPKRRPLPDRPTPRQS